MLSAYQSFQILPEFLLWEKFYGMGPWITLIIFYYAQGCYAPLNKKQGAKSNLVIKCHKGTLQSPFPRLVCNVPQCVSCMMMIRMMIHIIHNPPYTLLTTFKGTVSSNKCMKREVTRS